MSRLNRQFFPDLLRRDRRNFLKKSGLLALLPMLSKTDRLSLLDIFGGEAFAEESQAADDNDTIFIEINLRDQWDLGHVFVPPGIARFPLLQRGDKGRQVALFDDPSQIVQENNNFYLTQDALPLRPHLEHIALLDSFELCIGMIHGHEAANALRSPGRTNVEKSGYQLMSVNDPGVTQSNATLYSRTPTPAVLHNYHSASSAKRNGLAMRGIGRNGVTVYHFDAGLAQGQLDRFFDKDSLLKSFSMAPELAKVPINDKQAQYLRELLLRLDQRFVKSRPHAAQVSTDHQTQLAKLMSPKSFGDLSLALTPAEIAHWTAGVPAQVSIEQSSLPLAEQMAYASKLIGAGILKTVAMEFDYADFHGDRNERVLRTMARQIVIPLARLIESLKAQGLFHKTLIAVYTTDGSRSPNANSYGDEGKNSLLLAGGMIRGGYYGDIRVAETAVDSHSFSYHAPDPLTGIAIPNGARDNSGRLPGASGWRTVAKALKVPEILQQQFTDAMSSKPLDFLLR